MSAEHQILRSYSTGALLQIPIVGPAGCPGNSTPLQYSEQQASREKVRFSLFFFFSPSSSVSLGHCLSCSLLSFITPPSILLLLHLSASATCLTSFLHGFFHHFFSLHSSLWIMAFLSLTHTHTHTYTSTAKRRNVNERKLTAVEMHQLVTPTGRFGSSTTASSRTLCNTVCPIFNHITVTCYVGLLQYCEISDFWCFVKKVRKMVHATFQTDCSIPE